MNWTTNAVLLEENAVELAENFNPVTSELVLFLDKSSDGLTWQVPADSEGPFTFTTSLNLDGKETITKTISIAETGLNKIAMSGGDALGLDGEVRVIFPDKAAEEDLEVRVRPLLQERRPAEEISGHPFEVMARGDKTKTEIHKFNQPLTIEVAYEGKNDAQLVYYNEDTQTWDLVPGEYDREKGVVRGTVDHLSVFDVNVLDYQEARLPSIDSFQVSQFTGAATYSFPIWTPPGPGGLQPSLALSYNSQVVDSSFSGRTQASWVGMGWSLDVGYIERDFHGTFTIESDDTFNVLAGGTSSLVLKNSSGQFRLADENFWKLEAEIDENQDITKWTLWDKYGTKYTFGAILSGESAYSARARYPTMSNPDHGCEITNFTWKWMLTETIDKFGNKLEYYYHTKETGDAVFRSGCPQEDFDRAIYIKEIRYKSNSGRYRIYFNIETRPNDYRSTWLHDPIFFMRSRLSNIQVVHDPDGSAGGGAGTVIRTYTPSYNEYVFPGWEWSAGVRTFTLSSIVETGLNSTSLPATTFDYDGLHLISANNGYGGTVEFDYEDTPWYEQTASDDKSDSFGEAVDEPDWGGSVSLDEDSKIRINGTGTYEIALDKTLRVGGVYRLYFEFKNRSLTDAINVTVKVQHGDSPSESTTLDNLHSVPAGANYYPVYYYVAPQSSETILLLSITCNGACRLNEANRKLVTSKYRVNTRMVKDAITNPTGNIYQYTYDDPTTNYSDQDCYTTSLLYGDECTEFRGNAFAREIGPAGSNGDRRSTITWYSQSDEQKGNPIASLVGTNELNESFLSSNISSYASTWVIPNPNNYLSMERKDGDLALKTTYSGTSWAAGIKRQNFEVSDNEAILVHFKTGGASVGALLTAETTNWYTWGIYWQQAGTSATIQARYASSTALISYQNLTTLSIDQNKWYVLLLVMDNDHLYLRVWQRDNPANFGKYELYSLPSGITANHEYNATAIAGKAPVLAVSARNGEGLGALSALLAPRVTAALLGPSGAGKSTLVNALLGEARQATREVREEDRRGRHATTHRELFLLPSGGLLVDTPGLRELALWDGADGIAATWDEVSRLASSCRFRNCRHEAEPGCAVRAATRTGEVDAARLAAFEKLRREEESLEARRALGPARAERLRWKRMMGGAGGPEKLR
jgi:hypothetical protein